MQSLSEGVRSKIPWQELAMNAEECAELFGMTAEYFLRAVACKPTFPVRLTRKPATWKAGEVIDGGIRTALVEGTRCYHHLFLTLLSKSAGNETSSCVTEAIPWVMGSMRSASPSAQANQS